MTKQQQQKTTKRLAWHQQLQNDTKRKTGHDIKQSINYETIY